MANLTGRIPDHDELIEAFAQRIAASPAMFVILLENHDMIHPPKLLLNTDACTCIMKAGFQNFCLEVDARISFIADKIIAIRKNLSIESHRSKRDVDILWEQILSKTRKTSLSIHSVGDSLRTAKEVLDATHAQLKRQQLLVERLYVRPMFKHVSSHGTPLYYFHQIAAASINDGVVKTAYTIVDNLPHYGLKTIKLIDELGGPAKLGTDLKDELAIIRQLGIHYRGYGGCDASTAGKILASVQGRAIINFGADHGLIAHNPASLPDQLMEQAHLRGRKATVDLIRMMDSQHAAQGYDRVRELEAAGNLRTSVTVYDVELRREWPVTDWIKQAPQIYGWTTVPSIKPGQAPSVS